MIYLSSMQQKMIIRKHRYRRMFILGILLIVVGILLIVDAANETPVDNFKIITRSMLLLCWLLFTFITAIRMRKIPKE